MDLTGKVVLIVNSENALGPVLARSFAAAGAKVATASRGERARRGARGAASSAYQGDVARPGEAERLVRQTVEELGALDVLVILPLEVAPSPFTAQSGEEWDQALAVNVAGSLYASQAAARRMVEQGRGGRIIFLSSVASEMPLHETCVSGTTLAAANTIARVAAVELGEHGITVNIVAPAWVEFEDGARLWFGTPYDTDAAGLEQIKSNIPLQRVASAREVADVCLFLASDAASYVNGAYIPVDGGYAVTKGTGGTPYPGGEPWPVYDSGYDPATAPY